MKYFSEWLREEYGQGWDGIKCDLLVDGLTEEEVQEQHLELQDRFIDEMEEEEEEYEVD